jgi:hypothetical protein
MVERIRECIAPEDSMPSNTYKPLGKWSKQEFCQWVDKILAEVEPLQEKDLPHLWYNKYGDLLEAVTGIEQVEHGFFSEWVNSYLDINRGRVTNNVVGFCVWNFTNFDDDRVCRAIDVLKEKGVCTEGLSKKMVEMREEVRAKNEPHSA